MITAPPDTHSEPASTPLGSVVADRYQLTRLLGEGGFGAVFEAYDNRVGAKVALKIVSSAILSMSGGTDRFQREVAIVRRLSHPNIVKVLDAGLDTRGTLFIAFELLEGRSLEAELEKRGGMSVPRATSLSMQVLAALEVAHASGIVHRDLKPANVFLTGATGEFAKLLDFGIAKSTHPNSFQGLTQHGTMLGTPAYMAPEQLFGKDVGPAADLFAFGIVMAEMILGRGLYAADASPIAILQDRIKQGRVPLPDLVANSPLGPAIARALELEPEHRWASARQMRSALEVVALTVTDKRFTPPSSGTLELPVPTSGAQPSYSDPRPPMVAQSWDLTANRAQTGPAAGANPAGLTAAALAPPWKPPPEVATRRRSGGKTWLVVALLSMVAVAVVVGWLVVSSRPSKKTRVVDSREPAASSARRVETPPPSPSSTPAPTQLTPPSQPTPQPTLAPTVPGPAVEMVVARECVGVAKLTQNGLRSQLAGAGLKISGDLMVCLGTMVNFVCDGPAGKGFTIAPSGSAALIKLASEADVLRHIGEAKRDARGALTIAFEGSRVLQLDMPFASASSVLTRICK